MPGACQRMRTSGTKGHRRARRRGRRDLGGVEHQPWSGRGAAQLRDRLAGGGYPYLTCRFPGSDTPSAACQIDRTVPHPFGPTHPSNLKLLCGFQHLLKTFWSGGRRLVGSAAARRHGHLGSPSGKTYETKSAGAQFFPQLPTPTGEILLASDNGPISTQHGVMMPKRRRIAPRTRPTASLCNATTTPRVSAASNCCSPNDSGTTNHRRSDRMSTARCGEVVALAVTESSVVVDASGHRFRHQCDAARIYRALPGCGLSLAHTYSDARFYSTVPRLRP